MCALPARICLFTHERRFRGRQQVAVDSLTPESQQAAAQVTSLNLP